MTKEELKARFKKLAIATGWLCMKLSRSIVNKVYIDQLVRCSSSSASNYRSACRAKSKADFINKLRIVEEELDESMLFYELLAEFNPVSKNELRAVYKEADELLSITISSINTALTNIKKSR